MLKGLKRNFSKNLYRTAKIGLPLFYYEFIFSKQCFQTFTPTRKTRKCGAIDHKKIDNQNGVHFINFGLKREIKKGSGVYSHLKCSNKCPIFFAYNRNTMELFVYFTHSVKDRNGNFIPRHFDFSIKGGKHPIEKNQSTVN